MSWLVTWFLTKKSEVTVDEICRQGRSHLILSNLDLTSIENKTMQKIFHSKVTRLYLNRNQLTMRSFPRDFGFFAHRLTSLSLAENNLTSLPPGIGLLVSLKGLNISRNPFTCQELPVGICELKRLESLYANDCQVKVIPEEMYQLKELKVIGLRHNQIRDIPPILFHLPKLQWLTLKDNLIFHVPPEVIKAQSLVHFNLDFNSVLAVPLNTWDRMMNLRYLLLKSNQLVLTEALVLEMQKIPNLRKVDLSDNIVRRREWKPLQHKFLVTPESSYVPMDEEFEAEDIWHRNDDGLGNESSSAEISRTESHTHYTSLEPLTKDSVQPEQPRRHSEAQMIPNRQAIPERGSKSFTFVPDGIETRTEQSESPLPSTSLRPNPTSGKTFSKKLSAPSFHHSDDSLLTRRGPRDLTTHIALLGSTYEMPLETVIRPEASFEVEVPTGSETEAEARVVGSEVGPDAGLPPAQHQAQNPPHIPENGEDVVENEASDWEDSVDTDDLDDCDAYSDISDFDELPFGPFEAKFTVVSVLV